MTILDAIKDANLFRPFLADRDDSLASWRNWMAALRVVYGLPVSRKRYALIRECTGRDPEKLPPTGFRTALFLTGRRCGKSRAAALIAAFEAALAGREARLAPGERGYVPVVSPTKSQSRIVRDYVRAIFNSTAMLRAEVVRDGREGFELRNGVRIEILTADFRTIRGFTLLAAVVDELCFLGVAEESKVRNDSELIQALRPALLTTQGRLIGISSPYAKRGYAYQTWRANFGNDRGRVLVWNCPSAVMNPTLSEDDVAEMVAEDRAAAESEVFGRWRDDVGAFVSRDTVERLVSKGRRELLPDASRHYSAFADVSGGRGDDATLSIAHRDGRRVIVDLLKRWRPPFDPWQVIGDMAGEVRRFGLSRVTGDNYAAEFVARAFEACGVRYRKAEKNKSQLYLELLPRLCSGEVRLPDDPVLVDQLAALERRTRSGGKDVIDHPPGGHDDLANAVAGVCEVVATPKRLIGAL